MCTLHKYQSCYYTKLVIIDMLSYFASRGYNYIVIINLYIIYIFPYQ